MPTVLVVDDDASVRAMTALILERAGYGVVPACNGVEALMLYASYGRRIDAVLTDLDMPGMTGAELAARVKVTDPGARIVMMTGCPPEGMPALPDCRMLCKPFRPHDLLSALAGALGERR